MVITLIKERKNMNHLIRSVQEEINKMERLEKEIDDFLKVAPDGCLKWQHKRDKVYYYQQYKGQNINTIQNNIRLDNIPINNMTVTMLEQENYKMIEEEDLSSVVWHRKAIKKDNMNLAYALAKKHYYRSLKLVVKNKLKALRKFIQNYLEIEIDTIYDDMCEERKSLVDSIETTVKEKIKQWNEEVYEQNSAYSEGLRYETDQGDIVRSKSEVIIANILYQHRKYILYKYERPLKLQVNGHERVVYPDFSIMNLRTGKVMYWEHFGLMDDPHYANDCVWKVNTYTMNNLKLGRDVIFTFESSMKPLEIHVVKKIISHCIMGNVDRDTYQKAKT